MDTRISVVPVLRTSTQDVPLFLITIPLSVFIDITPIKIFVFLLLTLFFLHFQFFIEIAFKSMSFP